MADKKKVVINYIYSSAYQLFLVIIPIITTPYLARALTKDPMAINSYVSAIVQIFSMIGLIGLNIYSSREIAYVRDDKKKLAKTFSELLLLRIVLFIITVVIYIFYAQTSKYEYYFYIQSIAIMGAFIDITWFYSGLEEIKMIVLRSFVVKVINVISIFFFIKSPSDLPLFMVISSVYSLVGNLVLCKGVKKRIGKYDFRNLNIIRHIIPSIRLFLPQIASMVYLQVDKVMIGQLSEEFVQVGFYDQAERIVKMPMALITALGSALLPRISNEHQNNHKETVQRYVFLALRFSLLFALPLMFGLISIAPTMIPWYLGESFSEVIPIMMFLSPIVLFISISSVTGGQYLIAVNKTNILTASYVLSAIVNLFINFLLIPRMGALGAAIGTVAAELCACIFQLLYVRNVVSIKELLMTSLKYIIASLLMFGVCIGLGYILPPRILSTFIQIAIGILIYFITLLLLRDSFILEYVAKGMSYSKNMMRRKRNE